jgi:response regulator of citrate/malate metabolism
MDILQGREIPRGETEVPATETEGVEELTYSQLYADLIAASSNTLPDNHFTVRQFAQDAGLSDWTARDRLRKLVREKKLNSRRVNVDGNSIMAYWFNE